MPKETISFPHDQLVMRAEEDGEKFKLVVTEGIINVCLTDLTKQQANLINRAVLSLQCLAKDHGIHSSLLFNPKEDEQDEQDEKLPFDEVLEKAEIDGVMEDGTSYKITVDGEEKPVDTTEDDE